MNLERQPTVKDADSPAGHTFHAPKDFSSLPDCPFCRYGTPMEREGKWVCIDCGRETPKPPGGKQ